MYAGTHGPWGVRIAMQWAYHTFSDRNVGLIVSFNESVIFYTVAAWSAVKLSVRYVAARVRTPTSCMRCERSTTDPTLRSIFCNGGRTPILSILIGSCKWSTEWYVFDKSGSFEITVYLELNMFIFLYRSSCIFI